MTSLDSVASTISVPDEQRGRASPRELQPIAADVLLEKYAHGGERTIDEIRRRIALHLAQNEAVEAREAWRERFLWALRSGFLPGGRVAAAAGTGPDTTLVNSFVIPVGDALFDAHDGKPGVYKALEEAARTLCMGGGVGYDFSSVRPRGAWVSSTRSRAAGAVEMVRLFDGSSAVIEGRGSRKGAQMGVLRCDHPDIEAFIHAKDSGGLQRFNLSVGLTDAFMSAVVEDRDVDLVHGATPHPDQTAGGARRREDGKWIYRSTRARALWDQIMRCTYDHAEPGVLFLDRLNRDNNLRYCETIESTNPCAEQPLPDYGCCVLGALNLTSFVQHPFEARASFDLGRFARVAAVAVRMLDDALDLTPFPLPQQRAQAESKRRLGLGFTGLGDALVMLNLRYDTEAARAMAARLARALRDAAYEASVDLAVERGAFPLFEADHYLAPGTFASRLPEALKARIRRHGTRNSHLLSVAPTGTISLAFGDNVSNGIEPVYALAYHRQRRGADGSQRGYAVEDFAHRLFRALEGPGALLPAAFVTALDMAAEDHRAMVAAVSPFIDGAISKTVNVPADYPFEDFQSLYLDAWKAGLKGLATYRPNNVLGEVLSVRSIPGPPESSGQ